MKKIIIVFLLLANFSSWAQTPIASEIKLDTLKFKPFIVPSALLVTGIALRNSNINAKVAAFSAKNFPNFSTKADNYFQFAPIVLTYAGNLMGFASKHSNTQMLINHLISNVLVSGVVYAVKNKVKDPRPDNFTPNSFPSGHTTTAFNNATLHYLEYKDSNFWFASSGYLFAVSVASLRILNNRHWLSDVSAGAGLGMATALITYHLNAFHVSRKATKKANLIAFPSFDTHTIGFGLVYNFKKK